MFKSYRFLIVLAVVCALAAAYLSVKVVAGYVGEVRVIAAAANLDRGTVLVPRDLAWLTEPKGALYADTVVDPARAEGLVVRGYVPAGTVLRRSMLETPAESGIAGQLAHLSQGGIDYYALAVAANLYTTVGGQVRAGDRVDVYLTGSPVPLAGDVPVLVGVPGRGANGQLAGLVLAVDAREEAALLPHLTRTNGPGGSLVLVLRPAQGGK